MSRQKRQPPVLPKDFDSKSFCVVNPRCAGIDVGSRFHVVAVSPDLDDEPIRHFACYTPDLMAMVNWLIVLGITTVAMESTGVYWIPIYQILESRGIAVCLIRPQGKNLPGRKDDDNDAMWLQKLHTFGLLSSSFLPSEEIYAMRSYWRLRADMVSAAADELRHMQKALDLMNLHLHKAISDISGLTGMTILRAIVAGEHDPVVLAAYRDPRIKCKQEELIKALTGDYRREHLFALRQALERYDALGKQIADCDRELQAYLDEMLASEQGEDEAKPVPAPSKRFQEIKHPPMFSLYDYLYRLTGKDMTRIDGMGPLTVMTILSEVGLDMSKWRTEDHFASWLGFVPHHKISGGKILSRKTRRVINRAATAFRMAALALSRGPSALGAYYRRMRAKLGAPKALTATAHKLALLFYRLLRFGEDYVDIGAMQYEEKFRAKQIKSITRRAAELGLQVTELAA